MCTLRRLFNVVTALAILWPGLALAQPDGPITTHIGYGVHFGPNTDVTPDYVYRLNVDWVKVYTIESAFAFASKRVLYRLDVTWPDDWNEFRRGLREQAQAIAAAPIEAVEVHNEPNLSLEWGNRPPNAWQFVQVLKVAYQTLKAVKPSLIVVSGGLAPTVTTPDRMAVSDLDFAREMFENGAGDYFDVFGYHPYGYNLPPEASPFGPQPLVFRRTERVRAIMEEFGVYKQMWLTEFGWLRDPREDGYQCSAADPSFSGHAWMTVPGTVQADYLERAFKYAHENWPWAGPMFVWNLNWNQMSWLEPCNHMRWFGLIRPNGQPTLAYIRLQTMPRYTSDYLPRLTVSAPPLRADVRVGCPQRVSLGKFSVENIGYPAYIEVNVQPVNAGTVFVEAVPARARPGQKVELFVSGANLKFAGQYPVYINLRMQVNGRAMSQSLTGAVMAYLPQGSC
jgi:hypothetical protein